MRLTRILIGLAFSLNVILGAISSSAANITWGASTGISSDSDVSTTGTLVAAYKIGDANVLSTTINGVTFEKFPIVDGTQSTTIGFLTVSTVAGGITSTAPLGSANAPFSGLSANYQALLNSGAVKTTSPPVVDATLSGLNIGTVYTVQLWTNDSRPNSNVISVAGGSTITFVDPNTANTEGGLGQYVVGTFTANATTQNINFTGSLPLLNGIQLRTAIPEPSTLGLLAAAALLVVQGRCKKRR